MGVGVELAGLNRDIRFDRRMRIVPRQAKILILEIEHRSDGRIQNQPGQRPRGAPVDVIGVGDYQPAERKFELTRRMLEVCLELGFPVFISPRPGSRPAFVSHPSSPACATPTPNEPGLLAGTGMRPCLAPLGSSQGRVGDRGHGTRYRAALSDDGRARVGENPRRGAGDRRRTASAAGCSRALLSR